MSVQSAPLPLARTPLYDLHLELGARLVPFAGYEMPVQYPPGVIAEHLHTRAKAGLFDVSHMGQALFEGAHALRAFERLTPGDIASLNPGQMRYTQLLDANGHILDDLMVTRLANEGGRQRLFLVVNAASKAADFAHISAALPGFALTPLPQLALLALQGPQAAEVLEKIVPVVSRLTFMRSAEFEVDGVRLRISRSGYTGEDGFEISLPAAKAEVFARTLLSDPRVFPVGLGARDSLRLEAGLCLCGHDIDGATDPVEAGLLWSISKRRRVEGGFPGFARLAQVMARGPERRRVGLILDGKAPAREGAEIETPDGRAIGRLTSGGYAPSLGRPIAMGYVAAAEAVVGAPVNLIVRGKPTPARIAATPFMPHAYVRGA
ncbi:glycine cleavage system T protein [Methylocella silvestris BL2]|uniref:aminomethyltransferase n=1 Tax=Methylocella silvestris (strain DSM 15510 / CIP 108128 / LMG 27833 / NCIMB 13906 / BL2) TaxID=395965 RepID=B8EPI1_METSB|nr:glycine cleavage system aminomethyltransferase GcvT [Methylocella silvestris]ACK50186.1 glycine cleavage system T protein [Methylocella silvestris BL2]